MSATPSSVFDQRLSSPTATSISPATEGSKRISVAALIAIVIIIVLVVLIVLGSVMAATVSRVTRNARLENIPLAERQTCKHSRIIPQDRVATSKLPPGISRAVLSNSPIVDALHGMLTSAQCRHLIAVATPRFKRSVVVDATTGKSVENVDRTSSSVFLERNETPTIVSIQAHASKAAGMPESHLERLQVVRYYPGQFYKPHYDYLENSTEDVLQHGQRVITVFVYLNDLRDEETGGGTRFPHLDLVVRPEEGKAALWHDVTSSGNVDPRTLHGGDPLKTSVKYGLNCWWRDRPQV